MLFCKFIIHQKAMYDISFIKSCKSGVNKLKMEMVFYGNET